MARPDLRISLSFLPSQESTLPTKMDTREGGYDTLSGSTKTANIVSMLNSVETRQRVQTKNETPQS